MRIAIVGAGAIGCALSGALSDRGNQVTLVGRQDQIGSIQRAGLILHAAGGASKRYQLEAVTRLGARPDLVLLTVKTQDVATACASLLPLAQGVPVVTMQNGVRADNIAADVLGREAVVGAVVMCAASYTQPGEVAVQFAGWLIVGEPFGPLQPRTRVIAEVLEGAAPTYVTRRLARVRWSKLISNLNNGIAAATGLTAVEINRTPAGRRLTVRVLREGCRVARAAGIHLDRGFYGLTPRALRRDPNAALIALLQSGLAPALTWLPEPAGAALLAAAGRSRLGRLPIRGSTWQSIARGRPSEILYLNGEIVRLGRQHGVPTPYNAHLVGLVQEVERTQTFHSVAALYPPGAAPPAYRTATAGAP